MTVKEAARLLQKSEQFVRIGLQRGVFPFGVCRENVKSLDVSHQRRKSL